MRSTHNLWSVGCVHALAVEQEAHTLRSLALSVAEGVHELLELCRSLDLEEHFVASIRHLDVQVFAGRLLRIGLICRRGAVVFGHGG